MILIPGVYVREMAGFGRNIYDTDEKEEKLRMEDKKLYLEKLEEQYGLTEIPEGYALHHDSKNGNMQLIKTNWHKEFTHAGGHSLFKEG